jgi:hypothetical protein
VASSDRFLESRRLRLEASWGAGGLTESAFGGIERL